MQNLFSQTFAKDRTESDILAHEPIKLRLGKKDHDAIPLTLKKGKAWREKVAGVLNALATGMMSQQVTADNLVQGLMVALFAFPDQVLDLLIAYSPEILEPQRDWLMDNATDEEVVLALSRVLVVAYPYFSLLGTMKTAAMATDQATSQR
jgi:hypothetical protein